MHDGHSNKDAGHRSKARRCGYSRSVRRSEAVSVSSGFKLDLAEDFRLSSHSFPKPQTFWRLKTRLLNHAIFQLHPEVGMINHTAVMKTDCYHCIRP